MAALGATRTPWPPFPMLAGVPTKREASDQLWMGAGGRKLSPRSSIQFVSPSSVIPDPIKFFSGGLTATTTRFSAKPATPMTMAMVRVAAAMMMSGADIQQLCVICVIRPVIRCK